MGIMDNGYNDAPEGATHYNSYVKRYYKCVDDHVEYWFAGGNMWIESVDFKSLPKQEPSSPPQEKVEETNLDIWENAPEGAEWYLGTNKSYYRSINNILEVYLEGNDVWRTSFIQQAYFFRDESLISRPPKEDAPLENEQLYVDWSKAPEGCNAVHLTYKGLFDGVPVLDGCWEAWNEDKTYYDYYFDGEWHKWHKMPRKKANPDELLERIFRPKEEIVSAKRNDDALKDAYKPWNDITVEQLKTTIRFQSLPIPDYSKIPEETRVVEPVDMYAVHKYIKDNLKLANVAWADKFDIQLVLDGEVISEI
jgi:hypothetical protein